MDPIDRVAPTIRPSRRVVMRQNWHHLLFLHWELPADQVRSLIPAPLDLDVHDGRAYVGLVPFTMTGVRPIWAPAIAPISNFHETNVRTYVHLNGRDPGVWFFSLDAACRIAVLVARACYHLPYYFASMDLTVSGASSPFGPRSIRYESQRLWPAPVPALCAADAHPTGPVTPARPGSLEHFLAERYLLYAAHGTKLYQGQVHHAPYPLQTAKINALDETMLAAAGLARPRLAPLAHYARGVNVEIFSLRRVARDGP